jgi:hypothetical protein
MCESFMTFVSPLMNPLVSPFVSASVGPFFWVAHGHVLPKLSVSEHRRAKCLSIDRQKRIYSSECDAPSPVWAHRPVGDRHNSVSSPVRISQLDSLACFDVNVGHRQSNIGIMNPLARRCNPRLSDVIQISETESGEHRHVQQVLFVQIRGHTFMHTNIEGIHSYIANRWPNQWPKRARVEKGY